MIDQQGRNIDYMRISITDRCNLRCRYCMPEQGVPSLAHQEILRYDEVLRLARLLIDLGVDKFKLTGGEPLVRRGCVELVAGLKSLPGCEQVTLTTNGLLLAQLLPGLEAAGLDGVNISLDTLDPARFRHLTRVGDLSRVLEGLAAALASDIPKVKLNCVPQRGVNEDELIAIARLAQRQPLTVRFIELMPIGAGGDSAAIPSQEVAELLMREFGPMTPTKSRKYGNGPAVYYQPAGFRGKLGLISAVSHAFCDQCNRVRLTADGFLKLCLYYHEGVDLKALLRSGATDEELRRTIAAAVSNKPRQHDFSGQGSDGRVEQGRMSDFGG